MLDYAETIRAGLMPRSYNEASAALDAILGAYADALSGLRYIEQRYGRLDGVGWDRVLTARRTDGRQA